VISIKKLIEGQGPTQPDGKLREEELFPATLTAYRAVLHAFGESSVEACPPVGATLRQNLLHLQARLSSESASTLLPETEQKVEAEIAQWGHGAADFFKQRTAEVKELMLLLARTAEHTAERDHRYAGRFQEFTGRLRTMADLHDLAQVRNSLVQSAVDLKACADAMAEESEKSVNRLRQEVSVYQERLEDAERLAGQDPLTGLENRRRVESAIERRLERKKTFSVLLLDLNEFKQLNDTYGHLAGDEVLKQFSVELKSGFRPTEVVGRWGGDEFLVVLDAGLKEAHAHAERIARWVCGDYTIHAAGGSRRVPVSAAIGATEWKPADTLSTLLDRADAAMYRNKSPAAKPRA
jgi:diguanylate cyclase (GGDEF)-like protein